MGTKRRETIYINNSYITVSCTFIRQLAHLYPSQDKISRKIICEVQILIEDLLCENSQKM